MGNESETCNGTWRWRQASSYNYKLYKDSAKLAKRSQKLLCSPAVDLRHYEGAARSAAAAERGGWVGTASDFLRAATSLAGADLEALFTTCRVRLEISLTLSIMMSDTNRTETSMATVKRRGRRTARQSQRSAGPKPLDPILSARLNFALSILAENGKLKGVRSERVSARVDPGLIQAARVKTGFENDSDLVNAALAVLAMPDDFGPWFVSQAGRLPKDFELEL